MQVIPRLPATVTPKLTSSTPWLHALMRRLWSAPPASPGLLDRGALAIRAAQVGALLRAQGLEAGQACLIVDEAPACTLAAVLGAWLAGARPAVHASTMGAGGPDALLASLRRLRGLLGAPCPVLLPAAVAAEAPGLEFLLGVPERTELAPLPSDHWHVPRPSELAYFQLSSGTTGHSKAIAIRWSALMADLDVLEGFTGGVRRLASWLPLNHDFGFTFVLSALSRYDALALARPADFMVDPLGWLQSVASTQADHLLMPPFALSYALRRAGAEALAALDLRCVRRINVGGESVHPGEAARFLEALTPTGLDPRTVMVGYGLGEATCATHLCVEATPIARVTRGPFTPGSAVELCGVHTLDALPKLREEELFVSSVGRPGLGVRCWLVDAEGVPMEGDLRCGEVVIDGPMRADGYLRTPGSVEPLPRGGVRTGDVGFHHDGHLYLVDRLGNLIIRRGCNFLARELEVTVARALGLHHGRVLVVDTDLQDPESALAVVVQHGEPLDQTETVARLAGLDLPAPLSAVYRLAARTHTRTSSGKKRYAWLRHLIATGALKPEITLTPEPRSAEVHGAIAEALAELGRAAARPEDRLREDLGLDSLTFVELISVLASKLGVSLNVDVLVAARTVAELSALLSEAPAGDGARFEQTVHARVLAEIPQMLVEVEEQHGRSLRIEGRWVEDFASCNYLAMDLDEEVLASIGPAVARWGTHPSWTRAVASPAIYRELERALAELVDAPDVLCFPSVTLLHAGVLPVLCGAGALLVDTAAHASIQDAALLAQGRGASVRRFPHGDLESLESQLRASRQLPTRVIAVDGVYSMSGGTADLPRLCALARRYDATVYVDDAHGLGLLGASPSSAAPWGRGGGGVVRWFGLDYGADRIVYVSGLSKAFSSMGAFVTCRSPQERERLTAANTFVFSGPLPVASIATALAALRRNAELGEARRAHVLGLSRQLIEGARALGLGVDGPLGFPIVTVITGGLDATIRACKELWRHGVLITPAVYPAMPLDAGGVRFSLTAANTQAQVSQALTALDAIVRGR